MVRTSVIGPPRSSRGLPAMVVSLVGVLCLGACGAAPTSAVRRAHQPSTSTTRRSAVGPSSSVTGISSWPGTTTTQVADGRSFQSGPVLPFSGDVSSLDTAIAQGMATGAIPGSSPTPGVTVDCPASAATADVGEILGCAVHLPDGTTEDLFVKIADATDQEFIPGLLESGETCAQLGTALWPAANELGSDCT